MAFVKEGRPLVNHILRMLVTMDITVNLSWVKVVITFLAFCNRLRRSSGMRMLIIYLKAAFVVTQQAAGAMRLQDMSPLGVRFARTGTGLPRIIPSLHRRFIRAGDPRYIRFWLTLFSMYRILDMGVKAKINTITDPSIMDSGHTLPLVSRFIPVFISKLICLIGFNGTILTRSLKPSLGPLWLMKSLKAVPFLIPKTGPAARALDKDHQTPVSTSPASLICSAKSWLENPMLFQFFKDWCNMTGNTYLINRIESWSKVSLSNVRAEYTGDLGKLGFKEEAAGKLRVFAMVDPFTQWLFKPLWNAILAVLDRIPQDGTLDQLRPVNALLKNRSKGPFYSFDLSAATDRLPILVQQQLLARFVGSWAATIWATLLVGRAYKVPGNDYGIDVDEVFYEAGQPMGALTSWGMLAFTHHFMVQWAAHRAGVVSSSSWFPHYAILGDDIVIADKATADEYVKICAELGVQIGLAKSLLSSSGTALEFAKRTFVRNNDVSAVPFTEYWVSIQVVEAGLEFARKYSLSAAEFLRLHGAGWRTLSGHTRPFQAMGKRWMNLLLAYVSPLGVAPRGIKDFLLSRSISKVRTVRPDTAMEVMHSYTRSIIKDLLSKLDSELPMWSEIRKRVTVTKYYGKYSSPTAPPVLWFDDIYADPNLPILKQLDDLGHVLEEINSTVYRTAFLDVLSDVRTLREEMEAIVVSPAIDLDKVEEVINQVETLFERLENLPVSSKDLFVRREEAQMKIRDFKLAKVWVSHFFMVSSRRPTYKAPDEPFNG